MSKNFETLLSEIPQLDVLVFAPHPDDAELFCGGTIAQLSKTYRVGLIDITKGEASSRGTVAIREKETAKASTILCLAFRGNLCIPDTTVFKETPLSVEEQIRRTCIAIRLSKPSVVLTPYGETRHPDHQGTRSLIQEALFYASLKRKYEDFSPFTVPITLFYMCRSAFSPSVVIDVTSEYNKKMDAIRAFSSQIDQTSDQQETLVSHPLSLSSIEARDAFYGSMIGVQKGEPFYIEGPLPLSDPHDLLQKGRGISRFILP